MQPPSSFLRSAAALLTLMHTGRIMTLAFIGSAGTDAAGAAPAAWLMPLLGDAIIGLSAPLIAYLVWRGRGLGAFAIVVAWHVVGAWDALSAFVVHISVPWPAFFMVQIFGSSMFFMATAMHVAALAMLRPTQGAWLPDARPSSPTPSA